MTRRLGAASAVERSPSHSTTTRASIDVPAVIGEMISISHRARSSTPGFTSVNASPRCDQSCEVPRSSGIMTPLSCVLPGTYTARFDGTARSTR